MVKVDIALLELLLIHGKVKNPPANFALWRAITQTPSTEPLRPEWVWDTMGNLLSRFRHGMPADVNDKHYLHARLQLTLRAIEQQAADPVHSRRVTSRAYGQLKRVLQAWERAIARALDARPQLQLSHDEWAGFADLDLKGSTERARAALGELGLKPSFIRARRGAAAAATVAANSVSDAEPG